MKKLFVFLAVASLAPTGPAGATATNMLTNGSFELGSDGLQGWTVNNTNAPGTTSGNTNIVVITYGDGSLTFGEQIPADGSGQTAKNPGLDPIGSHGVYFASDNAQQSLSQTVTLQAGKSYTFGFDIYKTLQGANNAGDATFTASLGGNQFIALNTATSVLGNGVWTTFSGASTFNATTSGTFALNFTTAGYMSKDFVVDRVYLAETSAVPEPATLGIMAMGVGLVGAGRRRRKAVAA